MGARDLFPITYVYVRSLSIYDFGQGNALFGKTIALMEIRFGDRMLLMAGVTAEQRCFDGRFAANWLSVLALIFLWKSLCLT